MPNLFPMPIAPSYTTNFGAAYYQDSLELLAALPDESINLVMTSPPFALQRQKAYCNKDVALIAIWVHPYIW
jgi:hypothetical protein